MDESEIPLRVEQLHGLSVVVADLDRAIEEFGRFFGIDRWDVRRFDTTDTLSVEGSGGPVDAVLSWASGGTSNLRFDLIQPIRGDTLFARFLEQRGPGVIALGVKQMAAGTFAAVVPRLARDAVSVLQSFRFKDGPAIHYLDSVGQLGTVVSVTETADTMDSALAGLPVDRVVTVTLPPEQERLPIDRPYHVCVLTRDRRLSVRDGFRRILGVEDWFEYDNEAGVTSTGATYHGRLVEGRFRLALGRRERFAVEVVEMMFGENVYQDMLDTRGEGVHHVMTTILSPERLDQALAGLKPDGFTMVQDGKAGEIYYGYLAAAGRIADLAVEVLSVGTDDPAADFGGEPWAILRGPDF